MAIKTIVFASTLYFACFEAIAAPVVKSQELEELKASVRAVTTVDSVSNDVRRLWTIAFVVADRCRGFRANSGTRPVMPFEPSTPERTEAIRSVSRLFQQLDGPAEACREFYRAFGNGGTEGASLVNMWPKGQRASGLILGPVEVCAEDKLDNPPSQDVPIPVSCEEAIRLKAQEGSASWIGSVVANQHSLFEENETWLKEAGLKKFKRLPITLETFKSTLQSKAKTFGVALPMYQETEDCTPDLLRVLS